MEWLENHIQKVSHSSREQCNPDFVDKLLCLLRGKQHPHCPFAEPDTSHNILC